jgi:hypothetical protein
MKTKCTVRKLGAEINITGAALEFVEILRETRPIPRKTLMQRRAWDVFDAFHQLDETLTIVLMHWSKANTTVAHDDCGDTVPTRGSEC